MDIVINQKNFQISFPLYLFSGITPSIFHALLQERTALLRSDNFFILYRSSTITCVGMLQQRFYPECQFQVLRRFIR